MVSDRLLKESDVIEAFKGRESLIHDVYTATAIIRSVPSADRPQGEWIIEYNGNGWNDYWDYICPNCGKKYERADAVLYKANFCPNCGTRMKGTEDE
jgi:DNA-directed RNA polymerase subunit RPC12/RpoP